MRRLILTILMMLVIQIMLTTSFPLGWVVNEAQAADLFGATFVDREAPSVALRIGLTGLRPTVSDVGHGSVAERSGLRKGDLILELGKTPVNRTSELLAQLEKAPSITVLRNTERLTLSLTHLKNAGSETIAKKTMESSVAPKNPILRSDATRQISAKPRIIVDKLKLQELLLNSKFDLLEKELNRLQGAFRKGEYDDGVVNRAFSAFHSTNPEFDKLLSRWIEKNPSSAVAWTARGYYYSHLGWTCRGTAYANETQQEKLHSMGDYFRKAVADLTEANKLDTALSVTIGELIRMARGVGNSRVTEALVSAGLQHNPGSYVIRANYLASLQPKWGGSMEEIRNFLASMEEQINGNRELSVLRGYPDFVTADTFNRDENYQDALVYYTKALAVGLPVRNVRGRIHKHLGQYAEALSDFNAALENDPLDIEALEQRGMTYYHMRENDLAMADFDAAIQLDPLNPSLLVNRAHILQQSGHAKEAFIDLRASLKYDNFNPWTYYQMGKIEEKTFDNLKTAKKYLRKSIELKPGVPEYLFGYLGLLYKLKECSIDLPVKEYQRACATSPSKFCSEEQMQWVDKFYRYAKNNPAYGCK